MVWSYHTEAKKNMAQTLQSGRGLGLRALLSTWTDKNAGRAIEAEVLSRNRCILE